MNRKGVAMLFCIAAIMAVVILASSLHDVSLRPGRSFASAAAPQPPLLIPLIQVSSQTPLWKILLVWLALVVNLVLFFLLLPPEVRKRIIRQVLSLAVGLLAVVLALRYRLIEIPGITSLPASAGSLGESQFAGGEPLPAFQAPQVAPWAIYLITLALLTTGLLLAWLGYRRWRRARLARLAGLRELAGIARSSLDSLATGRSWGDVVVECYARMGRVVGEQRGLQRGSATTPREFANALQGAGLPAEAVSGLTRLFESVRYGNRGSSEIDRTEAVGCLNSILLACGAR